MCSYAKGPCDFESNALLCKTKSTVFCRNLREKNEAIQKQEEINGIDTEEKRKH